MTREFLAVCGLFTLMIADSARAEDAARCAPRDMVVSQLTDRFGESRQAMGLNPNNTMMELYASAETGSWTITITGPNGTTCVVAIGQSFEAIAEELRPAGLPI